MDVLERLKRDEGFRPHPYRCTAGALTIGYGRNIDPDKGGKGISEIEASFMLRNDLAAAEIDMKSIIPNFQKLDPVRRGALLNMRFQLGPGGFRSFKKMIAAVNRMDYPTAALEAQRSAWWHQTPERAVRVVEELRHGISS